MEHRPNMTEEYLLQELFDIQRNHNKIWQDAERFKIDKEYRERVMKDYVLGIAKQNADLLQSFNWGKHIFLQNEDIYNTKIQLIDIAKYTLAFFLMLGGDAEEFASMFKSKSELLDKRWESNKINIMNNNVVIFDIDGVLADYDSGYKEFLEKDCGLVPKKDSDRSSYSYFQLYNISRQEEEKYNEMFIKSGGFRNLKAYDGVADIIGNIKGLGIKVVLVTARPNWLYKRIALDTYDWLKANNIKYDLVLWNKDKGDAIINSVFPADVLYMVEDRDKHAIEVTHIGVDVLLINKTYNQDVANPKIKRVDNVKEVFEPILRKWENKYNG